MVLVLTCEARQVVLETIAFATPMNGNSEDGAATLPALVSLPRKRVNGP